MKENELVGIIRDRVDTYYPDFPFRIPIGNGVFAVNTNNDLEWWYKDSVAPTSLANLNEEELTDIYMYLDANKYVPAVQEYTVKLPSWEDLNWFLPPKEILGKDGTVIGRIGTVYAEKRPEGSLMAVIYVSADLSWATLTMYEERNQEQRDMARQDVHNIQEALSVFLIGQF